MYFSSPVALHFYLLSTSIRFQTRIGLLKLDAYTNSKELNLFVPYLDTIKTKIHLIFSFYMYFIYLFMYLFIDWLFDYVYIYVSIYLFILFIYCTDKHGELDASDEK